MTTSQRVFAAELEAHFVAFSDFPPVSALL